MRSSERLAAYVEDTQSRFATVAMTDTNCLLRGQIVSAASLPGIFEHGMGMAPPVLALDPTGEILAMPSVTDGTPISTTIRSRSMKHRRAAFHSRSRATISCRTRSTGTKAPLFARARF